MKKKKDTTSKAKFIPLGSEFREPLQFPLLYPLFQKGWFFNLKNNGKKIKEQNYYKQIFLKNKQFWLAGRLASGFILDSYSILQDLRLNWFRFHQDLY